jgi:hypothetical protein
MYIKADRCGTQSRVGAGASYLVLCDVPKVGVETRELRAPASGAFGWLATVNLTGGVHNVTAVLPASTGIAELYGQLVHGGGSDCEITVCGALHRHFTSQVIDWPPPFPDS